ncbi:phosphotransferase enzyme family protein [Glycomyces algeriensis]|uniref:Aminoglycoside phosphotransferase n=1 Tax=Glycomyces algeriensis TaxID=256037 RepID=A0A9W6GB17_9ACTN|nr:phosphotransferase [Glycomyces algeriensis]MDA1367427.1 phosphotransferase [Glycomyces algeriensis]MDR7350919.1 Ser/Thr protein kinase RdoA (MazF antagonist) [Glycomyces algeriensis]GLI43631.1 aminoglycoside phosphotransferase [Glycomyces algeriensis]
MPPTAYADAALTAAETALHAYGLPAPLTVEPIRLLNNAVYAVTTEDDHRFVLRVHRPRYRLPEHTRSELAFLAAVYGDLAAAGVRVPKPLRTKDGALTVAVTPPDSPTFHCDLLTWVDGRVLRPGTGLGPSGVRAIGRALGLLHQAAESFTASANFNLPTWNAEALFTEASPYRPGPFRDLLSPADRSVFDTVADRTAALFDRLGTGADVHGIVHHDFILGNCHPVRTPQGWSIGVIDFDESGRGHYLADLSPVLGNLSDYPHFRRLRAALLEGYRSVRDLPAEHEAHFPLLMAARHAAQCLWAAGLVHSNGSPEVDTADHIAYRMWEVRRCLAMGAGS